MGNVWDGVKNTNLQDEFKCCNVYAKESAVSALPDFTVVGDVLQIRTISMEPSQMPMIWDVNFRRNVSNAQS
mgnify:FL=1